MCICIRKYPCQYTHVCTTTYPANTPLKKYHPLPLPHSERKKTRIREPAPYFAKCCNCKTHDALAAFQRPLHRDLATRDKRAARYDYREGDFRKKKNVCSGIQCRDIFVWLFINVSVYLCFIFVSLFICFAIFLFLCHLFLLFLCLCHLFIISVSNLVNLLWVRYS